MKHLFTIHSPLTFLVAYSVVEHLQLNKEEVVFISSNYKVPIAEFRAVPSFQDLNKTWYQKIKEFNVPKYHDRYINKITGGEDFIAYVDLMSYYQKILITQKQCVQFHFLEEGNSAYQEFDDLTDITWNERAMPYRTSRLNVKSLIRILRGFNLRLLALPYIYSAYANIKGIRFFAFSRNAFYNISEEKRILLKPNPSNPEIRKMSGMPGLSDEVIWIDGSNSRYTGLSEEYYYRAIQKAIDKLKAAGIIQKKVYVKLRPGLVDYSKNKLVKILQNNKLEVLVLPDKMNLECFFIISKNCHVIGTLTAALEYAYVFGHKAYSIYSLFEKQPPTFFDRMTGFWKNVERL